MQECYSAGKEKEVSIEMRNIMEKLLLVINIISGLALVVLAINGFFYEILDSGMYEKLLRWLKIPWSEGEIFKISYAVLAIFVLVLFLRSKFFNKKRC